MEKTLSKSISYPLVIVAAFVWLYVLVPFIAPVAYINGNANLGWGINQVYEKFCHQRVERSVFLFGHPSPVAFYTVEELKAAKAIPEVNPNPEGYIWPEYFGHDYVGNDEVGYKVPLCIRDIALYEGIGFTLLLLPLLIRKLNISISSWKVSRIGILLIPMAVDGVLQSAVEILQLKSFPDWYVHGNLKRIVTGALFGIGIGIIVYKLLSPIEEKSLTKSPKKGKMKV